MELMNEDNARKKLNKLTATLQSNKMTSHHGEHENERGRDNLLIDRDNHN